MSYLRIEREGDSVKVEGEGSKEEIRQDLKDLARDLDEVIAGPRLKAFADQVKDYLS